MATQTQVKNFIKEIAPYIQKYCKLHGYATPSAIIAQACCESAYGTSTLASKYHNYFGMKCGTSWKGKSVNLATKEEYTVGTLTNIKANFRVYDNMEDGVRGYFAFISTARYANLKTAKTPDAYLTLIKQDGYATSSTYVATNMSIVTKYNLTQYDANPIAFYAKYVGSTKSIVEGLAVVGETDTSFAHRKKVANANGITIYLGTPSQNTTLLNLLKQGILKKA